MNGLLEELRSNEDPEQFHTLRLTSECETEEVLETFLHLLRTKDNYIRSVSFRESFFPLRRLRPHLSHPDFERLLKGIAKVVHQDVTIPPTMAGMIRARLMALVIGPHCQALLASKAITFATIDDTRRLVGSLNLAQNSLHTINLQDSYVRLSPTSSVQTTANSPSESSSFLLDPLFQDVSLPHLEHFSLSVSSSKQKQPTPDDWGATNTTTPQLPITTCVHQEQIQTRRKRNTSTSSLLQPYSLRNLIQRHNHKLQTLDLSQLGLQDSHFSVIGRELSQLVSLRRLTLDRNAAVSVEGMKFLYEALRGGRMNERSFCPHHRHSDDNSTTSLLASATTKANSRSASTERGMASSSLPSLEWLQLRHVPASRHIRWVDLFPANQHLTNIEVTHYCCVNCGCHQCRTRRRTTGCGESDDSSCCNHADVYQAEHHKLAFWFRLNALGRSQFSTLSHDALWAPILQKATRMTNEDGTGDPSFLWHTVRTHIEELTRSSSSNRSEAK